MRDEQKLVLRFRFDFLAGLPPEVRASSWRTSGLREISSAVSGIYY
jgi:hypothetical protein